MSKFSPSPPAQAEAKPVKAKPKPNKRPKEDRDRTALIDDEKRRAASGRLTTVLGSASDKLGD